MTDREIDHRVRKKILIRRVVLTGLALSVLAAALVLGTNWLNPSFSRSRIWTATVKRGPIEAGITASGNVVPELNQVLSSPIEARVIRVLKCAGDLLNPGDPILELDVGGSKLSLDQVRQKLALRRNDQEKTRINLEHTLIDLKGKCRIKELELQAIQTRLAQNKALFRDGLISAEDVKRQETEEAKARIEWEQLLESERNAEISSRAQEEGLAMEMAILEKEAKLIGQELDLATTKADRKGVLTWVVTDEGITVRKGEVIARLADLSSFRVQARVSDVHASRLSIGLPVQVRLSDDASLAGSISQVLPSIENGFITFFVSLEQKSNSGLHSNQRVDVDVFTENKANALQIKKGPAIPGTNTSELFVIRGTKAIRTPVKLGIVGFSDYEILEGLSEGDEVVLSDTSEYRDLKEVPVKQ
jgi:HlyD family secretion protein